MADKGDVLVIVVACVIMAWIIYGTITGEDTYEIELIESVDIYSVSLHSDSTFMLGTGESYFNYYFFKDWGDGRKLDCVLTSNTKIIETDDETPKLKRYKIEDCNGFYSEKGFCSVTYYNELIVPTNTTQTTFRAEV